MVIRPSYRNTRSVLSFPHFSSKFLDHIYKGYTHTRGRGGRGGGVREEKSGYSISNTWMRTLLGYIPLQQPIVQFKMKKIFVIDSSAGKRNSVEWNGFVYSFCCCLCVKAYIWSFFIVFFLPLHWLLHIYNCMHIRKLSIVRFRKKNMKKIAGWGKKATKRTRKGKWL